MRTYIVKRLLLFVPVLFLVSAIIFVILHVVPGDVVDRILAGPEGEGRYTQAEYDQLRTRLGLDRPLYAQYLSWVGDVLRLDLGSSLVSNEPIRDALISRLPLTLELTVVTLGISLLIAIPAGVLSAVRQDTFVDHLIRTLAISGLTLPTFWTGSLLIIALVLFFAWTPPIGYTPPWDNPATNMQQIIFPAIILGYYYGASVTRMVRSTLLEVLRQDYIRTAWAKGLREQIVVFRHALRNAFLPVLTISAFQFGHLLGGTVIMETLFTLPGMGSLLIFSVLNRDYPVVQTMILLIAFFFLLINLAVDVLYAWLDPRISYV